MHRWRRAVTIAGAFHDFFEGGVLSLERFCLFLFVFFFGFPLMKTYRVDKQSLEWKCVTEPCGMRHGDHSWGLWQHTHGVDGAWGPIGRKGPRCQSSLHDNVNCKKKKKSVQTRWPCNWSRGEGEKFNNKEIWFNMACYKRVRIKTKSQMLLEKLADDIKVKRMTNFNLST